MAILTHGDGWHNYHHTFPWDYRTGDLGNYDYNVSATFVELFAKIGKPLEPLYNRNLADSFQISFKTHFNHNFS